MNPQISKDLHFLLLCSQSYHSKEAVQQLQKLLDTQMIEAKDLIALAYQHAVLPLVYQTLKSFFPTHPLCHSLRPYFLQTAQKNLSMSAHLVLILGLFKTHSIEALAFKGVALEKMVYHHTSLRQFGDLDILIQPKDKEKAMTLLQQHGYIAEIDLKESTKKTFFNAVNVLGFYHPSSNIYIEIHWELLCKNYAISWDKSLVWQTAHPISLHQHTIYSLAFEPHFLYLCVHSSKHLFERLLWVCDIDRCIRNEKHIAWQKLLETADTMGIHRMVLLSLSLAHTLLDLPLPPFIHASIRQDKMVLTLQTHIIKRHFTHTIPTNKGYTTFKLLWSMREKPKDKLRFLYFALFASKFDDFKWIQLPSFLAFLYPLLRIFRLGLKYFR